MLINSSTNRPVCEFADQRGASTLGAMTARPTPDNASSECGLQLDHVSNKLPYEQVRPSRPSGKQPFKSKSTKPVIMSSVLTLPHPSSKELAVPKLPSMMAADLKSEAPDTFGAGLALGFGSPSGTRSDCSNAK